VTRIDFYRYAEDKLLFACRLAAKAYEKSTRLVVYSPDRRVLAEFDRLLWGYQQLKFIPHCMAASPVAKETPVILAGEGDELPHHDVLLNLGDGEPPMFATFERLLEIVGTDDEDKQRARGRYTFYKKRGYEIQVNEVGGAA
jgi:DNA polymerase-3 subunit chi